MTTWLYLQIEALAALCGVVGTLLLALNGRRAGWGFVWYLGSSVGWLVFAHAHEHWGLFFQTVAFTGSSLLGAWLWLFAPKRNWPFTDDQLASWVPQTATILEPAKDGQPHKVCMTKQELRVFVQQAIQAHAHR